MVRLWAPALLCAFIFIDILHHARSGISRSEDDSIVLSRKEMEKISRIAEEKFEEELSESSEWDETDEQEVQAEFVEQTPPPDTDLTVEPEPGIVDEIEELKRNISRSNDSVECNITAGYLWELCRPVLLRTCKERYRTQCRTTPRKYQFFNRRLNRMFPVFRPPRTMFSPEPIVDWIEEQMQNFRKSMNNTSWQISLTITDNDRSRTYDNDDFSRGISNATRELRRAMNTIRRHHEAFFPTGERRHHKRPDSGIMNWKWLFGQDRSERREEQPEEDPRSERREGRPEEEPRGDRREQIPNEVPAFRLSGEREEPEPGDPSVRIPKSLPKTRTFHKRPYERRREKRSPSPHRYRPGMRRQHRADERYNTFKRPRTYTNPYMPSFHTNMRHNMARMHQDMRRNMERVHADMRHMRQRMTPPYRYRPPVSHGFHISDPVVIPPPNFPQPWRQPSWGGYGGINTRRGHEEEGEEEEEEEEESTGYEISCEQMEENPEICLEIAERTEKCEAELDRECPEYMTVRRQVNEKLENARSAGHEVSHISRDDDEGRRHETREKYEWTAGEKEGRPIVIESIIISKKNSGDAIVRAKIFGDLDVKLRIPGDSFESDPETLGKVISRMAMDEYRNHGRRRY